MGWHYKPGLAYIACYDRPPSRPANPKIFPTMTARKGFLHTSIALALLALLVLATNVMAAAIDPQNQVDPRKQAIPQRIASLNLCTDQMLLMLVPRARIASVTDWAARPESSYMAQAAIGIPVNYAQAEAVLPQHPDLVIAGEYNDVAMLHLLRQLGYRVEVVRVPQNLEQAREFVLHFGELVGAQANAQKLVAQMDKQLRELDVRVNAINKNSSTSLPLAAVYAPNGMTPGRNTVMAEILRRAGFRNLASELGINGYGQLALERLLIAKPDALIFEATADASSGGSIAHSYLHHPALQSILQHAPSVTIPPPLSECVGPMTIAAIERLVKMRVQMNAKKAIDNTENKIMKVGMAVP